MISPVCTHTDNGATGPGGVTCLEIDQYHECRNSWNDSDFIIVQMCCFCGGGDLEEGECTTDTSLYGISTNAQTSSVTYTIGDTLLSIDESSLFTSSAVELTSCWSYTLVVDPDLPPGDTGAIVLDTTTKHVNVYTTQTTSEGSYQVTLIPKTVYD